MASLASGLYDLFKGDPTLPEQAELASLGEYGAGTGEALTTAGAGEELGILSGDPTRIAQVEAPEITLGQNEVEQQRLTNANFGNRAGGTNASTQNAEGANRANIIDLTGNLIGNTAGAAVGQGSNLMGMAASDEEARAQMAAQRRQQTKSDIGGIVQGAGQLAEAFMPEAGAAETPSGDMAFEDWGDAGDSYWQNVPSLSGQEGSVNYGPSSED
jgi:hypothetical protein